MYFWDSNCICHLYLRNFIYRLNFTLYIYLCDIISICFYVQSVEHFVAIGLSINSIIIIIILFISYYLYTHSNNIKLYNAIKNKSCVIENRGNSLFYYKH